MKYPSVVRENMESPPKTVTVVGLGKLGSPLAATLAAKGFDVTGVDVIPNFIDAINNAKAPVEESRLQEMIDVGKERLRAVTNLTQAVASSDISFIVVPTPSKADGSFSTDYACEAAQDIAEGLKNHTGFHLVVLTSTVLPGDTERDLIPVLEAGSGKVCGRDFGVCYNPEFIALGNVIDDMLNPDFILIGESDRRSGDILEATYRSYCENDPPFARMNFANAELTKISVNSYITTRLSYANMLAEIASRLPGGDVDVVTGALGLDSRIGKKYLRGAVSYGGPCFPRDNRALAKLALNLGIDPVIAEATDRMNAQHINFINDMVSDNLGDGDVLVAILGLSYKPNTPVIEASATIPLIESILEKGFSVILHDPQALDSGRALFGNRIRYADDLSSAVGEADAVVNMTPWSSFSALRPEHLKSNQTLVLDCWRTLDAGSLRGGCRYITVGKGGKTTNLNTDMQPTARQNNQ
jgi:UDPglucose 6-dehydrogenase